MPFEAEKKNLKIYPEDPYIKKLMEECVTYKNTLNFRRTENEQSLGEQFRVNFSEIRVPEIPEILHERKNEHTLHADEHGYTLECFSNDDDDHVESTHEIFRQHVNALMQKTFLKNLKCKQKIYELCSSGTCVICAVTIAPDPDHTPQSWTGFRKTENQHLLSSTDMSTPKRHKMHLDFLADHIKGSILSKMDYKSLVKCRQTTKSLDLFVENNRSRITTILNLEWIKIRETTICIGRWGTVQIPKREIRAVQPKKIQFYRISLERVLSLNLDQFYDLEEVELMYLDEASATAVLDKLYSRAKTLTVRISTEQAFVYSNSFTKHRTFYEIQNIEIGNVCSVPDTSFLTSNHGTVDLMCRSVSNVENVIQAIKNICEGLISTTYIGFCLGKDIPSVQAVEEAFPDSKLIWSFETHEDSVFKSSKRGTFAARFKSLRFYALPVAGKKVGGLCTSKYGGQLRFKVFGSQNDYLKRIPYGAGF